MTHEEIIGLCTITLSNPSRNLGFIFKRVALVKNFKISTR